MSYKVTEHHGREYSIQDEATQDTSTLGNFLLNTPKTLSIRLQQLLLMDLQSLDTEVEFTAITE